MVMKGAKLKRWYHFCYTNCLISCFTSTQQLGPRRSDGIKSNPKENFGVRKKISGSEKEFRGRSHDRMAEPIILMQ